MIKSQLDDLRKKIDEIDELIIELLAKRMKVVKKIGMVKKQHHLPPFDPTRWQKVLTSRMKKANSLGLDSEIIKKIYNTIHEYALKIEEKL